MIREISYVSIESERFSSEEIEIKKVRKVTTYLFFPGSQKELHNNNQSNNNGNNNRLKKCFKGHQGMTHVESF
jgi:hypothetical protein